MLGQDDGAGSMFIEMIEKNVVVEEDMKQARAVFVEMTEKLQRLGIDPSVLVTLANEVC